MSESDPIHPEPRAKPEGYTSWRASRSSRELNYLKVFVVRASLTPVRYMIDCMRVE
jgi:hypothetical protein